MMRAKLIALFDPFILMLLGTVALASVLPPRGSASTAFEMAANIGIFLLFFLHGAKLSREAILEGAGNWRLHLTVLSVTFILFPILGVGMAVIPGLMPIIGTGMLFLTLLPSTVQSSIAFTSIARGNVAAAVCSASFSNLIGIFITPALAALLMGGHLAGMSFDAVRSIALQLLLPFVVGHLLRPWIGAFVARHKPLLTIIDRGSILLVVYTAFGAAVVGGIWHQLSGDELLIIVGLSVLLLAVVLVATWGIGKALGFPRGDAIVLLFCGSKKSLASGVPMAGVLFAPAQVGAIILPLMIFHQIQLIACAVIARRYGRTADVDTARSELRGSPSSPLA
ncbi:bile acid:sodium symporter [soil metagenome]